MTNGEMAEWSKAAASKAVILYNNGIVGSNPTLSFYNRHFFDFFYIFIGEALKKYFFNILQKREFL